MRTVLLDPDNSLEGRSGGLHNDGVIPVEKIDDSSQVFHTVNLCLHGTADLVEIAVFYVGEYLLIQIIFAPGLSGGRHDNGKGARVRPKIYVAPGNGPF